MKYWNVYFIQVMQGRRGNGGPIKIGVARNVQRRLDALQTANYNELKVICTIPCESKRAAYELERRLHSALRNKRIRGEWFKASVRLSDVGWAAKWDVTTNGHRYKDK